MVLVMAHIDKPIVRLATSAIFDKHLASLHHLNVLIFSEWLLGIDVEKWSDSAEDALDVLRIGLELILTDPAIDLFKLGCWVLWSTLGALLDEGFESEAVLRVNVRVMVEGVQEDETVGEEEGLIRVFKVFWVFLHVGV